jgi:hypothetical protein
VLGCWALAQWHPARPHLAPSGVGDRREASAVGGLKASAVGGTLEACVLHSWAPGILLCDMFVGLGRLGGGWEAGLRI